MRLNIVVVAREAGSAAALVPIAERLLRRGSPPVVVAEGAAEEVFRRTSIETARRSSSVSLRQFAAVTLSGRAAHALLTGTSMDVAADAAWWDVAREQSIPSVALLDHWSNLAGRFSVRRPFDATPDVIAVMDAATRGLLLSSGNVPAEIVITGHPHLDALPPVTIADRMRGRSDLPARADQKIILFASEPIARHHGNALGYTEADAIRLLRAAISIVDQEALLVLRPHPLEAEADLRRLAEEPGTKTVLSRSQTAHDAIAASDVVTGMRSTFLLEAARRGRPVISVRPGGGPEPFLDLHADEIASAVSSEALELALVRALNCRPQATTMSERPDAGGAVISLLEALVARAYSAAQRE